MDGGSEIAARPASPASRLPPGERESAHVRQPAHQDRLGRCFLLAWHLATTTGAVSPLFLPSPGQVVAQAQELIASGELLKFGADLLRARLRRLRARRACRGAARRGDGGVVARQGDRRSVRLAAAPAAVDHLDPAHHPLARHRRAAEGGDRLSRLLDLHPDLYALRSAARRSAADPCGAQSWRHATSR